jgi:hypothetical protein
MPRWMEAWSAGRDDALRGQHLGVRQAARDVGLPQALVKKHAGGVALDQVAHGLGKQRRPGLRLVSSWLWDMAVDGAQLAGGHGRAIIRWNRHPEHPDAAMQNTANFIDPAPGAGNGCHSRPP